MKQVTVIGSISTDFVVTTAVVPEQGETLFGETFTTFNGGKGSNQAVAASRIGAKVKMIGAVGDDVFGSEVLENLKENKIDITGVKQVKDGQTGAATIIVNEGDNRIIYVPGANNQLTLADIDRQRETLKNSDIVVMQNETPKEVIEYLIELCEELKVPTILNPAPAREISLALIDKLTYLTPNESEFAVIFPEAELAETLRNYPNKLIVTLGSRGAVFYDGQEIQRIPAYKVKPVDTTGAGDTFNGALAVALSNGLTLAEGIQFSNLASSLAVQVSGAQAGIPSLAMMKGQNEYAKKWDFK